MSSGYIQLKDVLEQMDQLDALNKGVPFDIKFVTCDRNRGTGGDILEIKGGRKCSTLTKEGEIVYSKEVSSSPTGKSKNPNHYLHATRNILLPNGQIRTCHIRLIIEFNGKKVCF